MSSSSHASRPAFRFTSPLSLWWRSPGVLQIGIDTGHAVVLTDAPPSARQALASFRQWSVPADVLRDYPGLGRAWFAQTLRRLRDHGFLAMRNHSTVHTVGIIGSGQLARDVVLQLMQLGHQIWVADPTEPHHDDQLRTGHRAHWHGISRHSRSGRLVLLDHWQSALGQPADIVVVCPATATVNRMVTDQLVRERQPHVVVGLEPERAIIGPLVVPGVTPCLLCQDLAERDRDPSWPRLVQHQMKTPVDAPPVVRRWAASTIVTQVLAFLAGARPETWAATLELATHTWSLGTRSLQAHQSCQCQPTFAKVA